MTKSFLPGRPKREKADQMARLSAAANRSRSAVGLHARHHLHAVLREASTALNAGITGTFPSYRRSACLCALFRATTDTISATGIASMLDATLDVIATAAASVRYVIAVAGVAIRVDVVAEAVAVILIAAGRTFSWVGTCAACAAFAACAALSACAAFAALAAFAAFAACAAFSSSSAFAAFAACAAFSSSSAFAATSVSANAAVVTVALVVDVTAREGESHSCCKNER
jgi:hypothetical protein